MIRFRRFSWENKGATLTELLIATVIFGAISLALISLVQYGTQSWRKVESRFDVEKGLRRAVIDINNSLRNTDFASVSTGVALNKNNNNWLAMKQSVRLSGNIPVFSDISMSADDSKLDYNFLYIYFLVSPANCLKCDALNQAGAQLNEALCPHKELIKRVVFLNKTSDPDSNSSGSQTSESPSVPTSYCFLDVANDADTVTQVASTDFAKISGGNDFSTKNYAIGDRLLATNIMNFSINIPASDEENYGVVQYTLRAFKELEASKIHITSASFTDRKYRRLIELFTLQIDQGVAPLNNTKTVQTPTESNSKPTSGS